MEDDQNENNRNNDRESTQQPQSNQQPNNIVTPGGEPSNQPDQPQEPSSSNQPSAQDSTPPQTQQMAGEVTGEYISNPVKFFASCWEIIKRVFVPYALAILAIFTPFMVVGVILGLLSAVSANPTLGLVGIILVAIIGFFFMLFRGIPMLTVILLEGVKGRRITLKEAYAGAKENGAHFAGASILSSLAIFGGFLLFIIPGLIFLAWFTLSPFVVIEENLGTIEAMKRSKKLVEGRVLEMIGLAGLPSALYVLFLIPILGPIAVWILNLLLTPAFALRYLQLKHHKSKNTLPDISPWNYAVIVVAILGLWVNFSSSANDLPNNNLDFNNFDEITLQQ